MKSLLPSGSVPVQKTGVCVVIQALEPQPALVVSSQPLK